jgi:iron complex transport system substrate-binding protein
MNGITEKLARPAIHISATLETTPEAFRKLGALLGRQEKGEALAVFCEKTLDNANAIMSKVGDKKISLLYCLGKQGTNVLARGSFHSEIIDMMSDNKAVIDNPASRGSGNETDLEQITIWNPAVIIFELRSVYKQVANDPAWKQLSAIKNKRYYEVPSLPYNWLGSPPSINRYLGMIWLGTLLYPQFATYDLYTEIAEYYKLFYGYTLTKEKFNEITTNAL